LNPIQTQHIPITTPNHYHTKNSGCGAGRDHAPAAVSFFGGDCFDRGRVFCAVLRACALFFCPRLPCNNNIRQKPSHRTPINPSPTTNKQTNKQTTTNNPHNSINPKLNVEPGLDVTPMTFEPVLSNALTSLALTLSEAVR
jgi:hypothetical protein